MSDLAHIRNFSIIAHIDHGKSTLADRILELTGTVSKRDMKEQLLDTMDLERERGITIKSQAVRIAYKARDGQVYQLNLIDTPGHVDFTYEVSRSLAACEGAVLLVDATQGVEAQTVANAYLALDNDLEIIPVLNKVDLPAADVAEAELELHELTGALHEETLVVSAKTGEGVEDVLEAVVARTPPPTGDPAAPGRALIFDSEYDQYRGVIAYVRVVDGHFSRRQVITMMRTGQEAEVEELGYFGPEMKPAERLETGEVGYIITGVKDVAQVRVGDTVTDKKRPAGEALPGYKVVQPMVFTGLFPTEGDKFEELRDALEKLKLNDAALSYEPESSNALGFGFRCGFLGLLHMDIVRERLEREYDLELLTTLPNVEFHAYLTNGTMQVVRNPAEMPDAGHIERVEEPFVSASVIVPSDFVGAIMELCQGRRSDFVDMKYLSPHRVEMHYKLPLSEIVLDFFDQLKSRTRGYASLDYEFSGYRESDLVKLEILLAGQPVDALSLIVPRESAHLRGKGACREAAPEDPAAALRGAGAGGDRQQGRRPRDDQGEAQGRARQVLRRRHHAQAQAAREAEGRQEAHEAARRRRGAAGGLPGRPRAGREPQGALAVAELVTPRASLRRSFVAALRETHAEGRHTELDADTLDDARVFAAYVAALVADVERPGEPDRFVEALTGHPPPDPPEGGEYVPQAILWWAEGEEFIGRLCIRHRLTEGLLRHGGHIGYEVRPGARRRGHATAMLAAALPVAAELGIELAHVDCDATNVASRRVDREERRPARARGRRQPVLPRADARGDLMAAAPQATAAAFAGPVRHLYVHVPFCAARCDYCDFDAQAVGAAGPAEPAVAALFDAYVEAVAAEWELERTAHDVRRLETLYFGGGTPALLGPDRLERLVAGFAPWLTAHAEVTVETNPDEADEALASWAASRAVRVSLGVQSFLPALRAALGRRPAADPAAAARRLRVAGVRDLSIDLMHGIPGQSAADLDADLAAIDELAPGPCLLVRAHRRRGDAAGAASRERGIAVVGEASPAPRCRRQTRTSAPRCTAASCAVSSGAATAGTR